MSRIFFVITFALLTLTLSLSTFVPKALAGGLQANDIVEITARSGLNIRDINCKKIGLLKFREITIITKNDQKTCQVGSKTYAMLNVGDKYIASDFVKYVGTNIQSEKATTTAALNLREVKDQSNCKKISLIPNNTEVKVLNRDSAIVTCIINGETYSMTKVNFGGKEGYVASKWLK